MASEMPLSGNHDLITRSGSGDSLLQRRANRLYQQQQQRGGGADGDLNSVGNASFHSRSSNSSSNGNMSNFFMQQQRRAIKKGERTSSLQVAGNRSLGGSSGNLMMNHNNSGGVTSSKLRNALGIQTKRTNISGDSSSSNVSFALGGRAESRGLGSHTSAPSLLAMHQQRMKNSNISTGNLSATSVSSQGSSGAGSLTMKPNEIIQVAQRSNGSTVKSVIARLKDLVRDKSGEVNHNSSSIIEDISKDEQDTSSVSSGDAGEEYVPLQEMALLSQWASVDAYYKVVISKYKGIPTILNIMKLYPHVADIQVYGLVTLSHLSNQHQIHECGGVPLLLRVMQHHSSNIELVSQGFGLLKKQAALLPQLEREKLVPLVALVKTAQTMYLTQGGKEGLNFCQQFLETYQIGVTTTPTTTNAVTAVEEEAATNI